MVAAVLERQAEIDSAPVAWFQLQLVAKLFVFGSSLLLSAAVKRKGDNMRQTEQPSNNGCKPRTLQRDQVIAKFIEARQAQHLQLRGAGLAACRHSPAPVINR